jgi:hypothetical protein
VPLDALLDNALAKILQHRRPSVLSIVALEGPVSAGKTAVAPGIRPYERRADYSTCRERRAVGGGAPAAARAFVVCACLSTPLDAMISRQLSTG